MPIDGQPNPRIHRHCRKCREWFNPWEGSFQWPEGNSLIVWLQVKVAQQVEDDSVKTWVCLGCHPLTGDPTTENIRKKSQSITMLRRAIVAMFMLMAGFLAYLYMDDLYLLVAGYGY